MVDDVTREQFERAAHLSALPDDGYARRWSVIHERMAEAAVTRKITKEDDDA